MPPAKSGITYGTHSLLNDINGIIQAASMEDTTFGTASMNAVAMNAAAMEANNLSYANSRRFAETIMPPFNDNFPSTNQALVGPPNRNTLVPPIITPPIYDLEYWRYNNLIDYNIINKRRTQELWQNGYLSSVDDGQVVESPSVCKPQKGGVMYPSNNYPSAGGVSAGVVPGFSNNHRPIALESASSTEGGNVDHTPYYEYPDTTFGGESMSNDVGNREVIVEGFEMPRKPHLGKQLISHSTGTSTGSGYSNDYQVLDPTPSPIRFGMKLGTNLTTGDQAIEYTSPGDIDTANGYFPGQYAQSNIPDNLPVGARNRDTPSYNDQIFTQTLTPGTYSKNTTIEPLNYNIGISFDQQFEPTFYDPNTSTYVAENPRNVPPSASGTNERITAEGGKDPRFTDKNLFIGSEDVFDPRFYGNGTQYRSYVDEMLGQPRFTYDDIDSIRRPNYITRNKIDFIYGAPTYGSVNDYMKYQSGSNQIGGGGSRPSNVSDGIPTKDIRKTVEKRYLDDTIAFRTEMQSRLMRKANANAWQQRVAPLSRACHPSGRF